jgi:hypothetical protein
LLLLRFHQSLLLPQVAHPAAAVNSSAAFEKPHVPGEQAQGERFAEIVQPVKRTRCDPSEGIAPAGSEAG